MPELLMRKKNDDVQTTLSKTGICSGMSVDMIRNVLKKLRELEKVQCLGRGQNAHWQKMERWK